jgi:hypothetical protein
MKRESSTTERSYEIRIEGHLDDRRAGLFENMNINLLPDGQTLISANAVDQSALFGILLRVRDLGIPLLSVTVVESQR